MVQKNKDKPIKKQKSYIGRTYKVNDNDLPHKNKNSNKIVNIAIIEENGKKVAGVRMSKQKTPNTHSFQPNHHLYKGYKSFLEIKFNDGTQITIDSKKLKENPWKNDLTETQVDNVRNTLYLHSRQAVQNRKNRDELKKRRH